MLLSILGHRLQQGRLQRLEAEVDAAAEAAAEIAAEAAAETGTLLHAEPPAPEPPAEVALRTEHGAPTPAALDDAPV